MKVRAKDITTELLEKLWMQFLERVSYANTYTQLVTQKGGTVVNDHIALRTLNTHTGEQPEGIKAIKHIIEVLGYKPVDKYRFSKRRLNAIHFEHVDPTLPRIFVSQLEVEELPQWGQKLIHETVKDTSYILSDVGIELLQLLKKEGEITFEAARYLIDDLVQYFRRPWAPPQKENVIKLCDVSQYGAWVLLHGNSVNHFTASINFQNVSEWPNLETTCSALEAAGVPMKENIEGAPGSKLRQSATKAVKEAIEVRGDDGLEKIDWTYAYYELAERGFVEEDGELKLFSGFLGDQAQHLFDMTRTQDM